MAKSFPFALLVGASEATSTEALVRAAALVASFVGDSEFCSWCQLELRGYGDDAEIPDYRTLTASLFVDDAFRTGVPAILRNESSAEAASKVSMGTSIAQVEQMARDGTHSYKVLFKAGLEQRLLKAFDGAHHIYRIVQPFTFRGVVVAVRQRVFDWAMPHVGRELDMPEGLRLEALLGSPSSVQAPAPVPPMVGEGKGLTFEIQGSGNNVIVQSSEVQASTSVTDAGMVGVARELVALLEGGLRQAPSTPEIVELRDALEQLRALTAVPNPRPGWLQESARSIRVLLEGTAAAVAGNLLTPHGQALLARLAG